MVREFNLINEKGQLYSLMDIQSSTLLTNPEGLGYGYETSYERLSDVFVENLRLLQQGNIYGDLNFLNYDNYNKFVNFIETSSSLRFIYTIPFSNNSQNTYLRDINIQTISKTQIRPNGVITEPVIFDCKTLWYEENETIFKIEPKDREIRWNFRWSSRFTSYNSRSIVFNNKGHTDAPFTVEIDGHVINPEIDIYVEDKLLYSLKVNITIEQYEKLLYSTMANNIYLYKQETDGTLTRIFKYPYIDVKNNNIFRLPKGSSEIRITAENNVLNAKLTIKPQYKVV